MSLPARAEIIEVGLRDGLQNEPVMVPTDTRLRWVALLAAAGVRRIQVTSFVHPARVPQMADAEALCAALPPVEGVEYSGLVLNPRGLERLRAAGLRAADMSVSASDAHSIRNTGAPTDEKLAELLHMVADARAAGLRVRAGIQCAFGFTTADEVPLARVLGLARAILDAGADEFVLADSAGTANPAQMQRALDALLPLCGGVPLVLHLHDTRGMGLANVFAALERGVTHFDTAFGGLGGCPFIPGAAGNIATEDTVHMLHAMGVQTGVDPHGVALVSAEMAALRGKALDGKLYKLNQESQHHGV